MKIPFHFPRIFNHFFLLWLILLSTVFTENCIAQQIAPLSSKVSVYKGRPTIFINDKPETPMIYTLTDCPGGRWTWEEFPHHNLQNFANQGFRLFQMSIWLQDIWTPDEKLNMELVRKQIKGILDVRPDAAVMIRFHINAPFWWNDAHPEECTEYADGPWEKDTVTWGLKRHINGDLDRRKLHSLASEKWRIETTQKVREFCRRLSEMPEGNAVISIHPADGVSHEWHYWGFIQHDPDSGPAMTRYFRGWLENKYKTNRNLQKAWNDSKVSFSIVTTPTLTEREYTSDGVFRDPQKERKVIDYYESMQEVLADDIIHYCKTIKESWPRPVITGVFYGYFFMMFSRQATGGHLKMDRILNSPYIDYLSAPQSYWSGAREMGGSGQSRGVLESCRLHGKLWLEEMDQSTSLTAASNSSEMSAKIPEKVINDDNTIIKRNVAHPFARGVGLWFYDFGPNQQSGWWNHPDILANIKKLKALYDTYLNKEYTSPSDVLVVYDTKCYYQFKNKWNPISENSIDQFSADLHRSGVMFDNIYLSDLEKVDLRKYKVVIFANTWILDNKQKEFIKTHVLGEGRHIIWNYMPGYSDANRIVVKHISEVTGLKTVRISLTGIPKLTIKNSDLPVREFALKEPVAPLIAIHDSSAKPLGYFSGTSYVAFAVKKVNNSTIWQCAIPLRDPALMQAVFKKAGAHIYTQPNDVVFSGGGILTLHTKEGGQRSLSLKNGKMVHVQLNPHSTTLFNSETGEVLLR